MVAQGPSHLDLTLSPIKTNSEASILNGGRLTMAATIPRVESRKDLPLSFAQEQLWFLAQMEGGNKAYQSLRGLRLQGELNQIGRAHV